MRRWGFGVALVCLAFVAGTASGADTGLFALTPFTLPFTGAGSAVPEAINNIGQIVGSYTDAAGHAHGFVRDARGHFATVDTSIVGIPVSDTVARGINDFGVIVGSYTVSAEPQGRRVHGFVRSHGVYTVLDAPFAGAFNTRPRGINDYGVIVGSYDTVAGRQAFVRSRGHVRRLTVPFTGADRFSFACTINNLSQILGAYQDAAGSLRGFLISDGETATINVPGAVETLPTGINDLGQIVGVYVDARGAVHSFFESNGRSRTIDLPGTTAPALPRPHLTGALFPALVPGVFGVSNAQITGTYLDDRNAFHGFLGVLRIPDEGGTRESAQIRISSP